MSNQYLATKTVLAIDAAIKADQGNSYRGWLKKVMPHIGDAYKSDEDPFRSHLGASILGRECGRELWYSFHWSSVRQHEGRLLRLFNRGHIEEARFLALLLMIGCQVYQQDEKGNQYRISHSEGHVGGSGDGVLIGVPDAPVGQAILGEFKTHNNKSFVKLAGENWEDFLAATADPSKPRVEFLGEGVRGSKLEHYVQAQLYMRKMGLPACLYLAVNKDNDSLYGEILMLNTEMADQFFDRGDKVVNMQEAPKRLNESPGFWKCRFCDFKPICHLKAAPARNCRTCAHSAPTKEALWFCNAQGTLLDKKAQIAGCPNYKKHPTFGK